MQVWRNGSLVTEINRMELTISDSGYARLGADWNSENVCSPYSRLYLVEKGEGILKANGSTTVMQPGVVYLIPPGLRFSYSCTSLLCKLYFHVNLLQFSGYDLMQDLGQIAWVSLAPERFSQILRLYQSTSFSDALVLKECLYHILGTFLEAYDFAPKEIAHYSPPVQKAIAYVQAHLSVKLHAEQLAKQLFVSKSFLASLFLQEMGVTLGKYVDDQLLFAAQWQLLSTDSSIGEISERLGFCDQFYFSRRFKQLCGETPLQYRKKIRVSDYSE